MIEYEQAKLIASKHVDGVSLGHDDYFMSCDEGTECSSGWYFDCIIRCRKEIPQEEREQFAGAPGFIVNREDGSVVTQSWQQYRELNLDSQ